MDEVLNPSGDRISVLRSHIKGGSKITVRTITVDGELSVDSGPAKPNVGASKLSTHAIRNRNLQNSQSWRKFLQSFVRQSLNFDVENLYDNIFQLFIRLTPSHGFNDNSAPNLFDPSGRLRSPTVPAPVHHPRSRGTRLIFEMND